MSELLIWLAFPISHHNRLGHLYALLHLWPLRRHYLVDFLFTSYQSFLTTYHFLKLLFRSQELPFSHRCTHRNRNQHSVLGSARYRHWVGRPTRHAAPASWCRSVFPLCACSGAGFRCNSTQSTVAEQPNESPGTAFDAGNEHGVRICVLVVDRMLFFEFRCL
jgi:hypothetical protein